MELHIWKLAFLLPSKSIFTNKYSERKPRQGPPTRNKYPQVIDKGRLTWGGSDSGEEAQVRSIKQEKNQDKPKQALVGKPKVQEGTTSMPVWSIKLH